MRQRCNKHLKTFMEVVRQGGFTLALQSAKQVAQLERDVGYALLDRSVGRLLLTPAGQVVYRGGEQMLMIRAGLQSELDGLERPCRGELYDDHPEAGCEALFGGLPHSTG